MFGKKPFKIVLIQNKKANDLEIGDVGPTKSVQKYAPNVFVVKMKS